MPVPQIDQIAEVTVGGQIFNYWTSIICERTIEDPVSTITLSTFEGDKGSLPGGWTAIKLMIGMHASVRLAGRPALTGIIDVRQVLGAGESHEVTIRVGCLVSSLVASTTDPEIDGQGGQFVNQTFQQIAQAIGEKVNVNVQVIGNPPGADVPFKNVSVIPGQTRWDFLAPLAAECDLHAVDDATGTLNYFRGTNALGNKGLSSGLTLVEGPGGNILKISAIMRQDVAVLSAKALAQQGGTDDHWGSEAAQISGIAYNNHYNGPPRPFVQVTPHSGDKQHTQMFANHLMSINDLAEFHIEVTVQGWLTPNNDLWMSHIGQEISVYSPMVLPFGADYTVLAIKGVKHIQTNEQGTISVISLCLPGGLGEGGTLRAANFGAGLPTGDGPGPKITFPPIPDKSPIVK